MGGFRLGLRGLVEGYFADGRSELLRAFYMNLLT